MLKKLFDITREASKCLGFCSSCPICFSFLSEEFLISSACESEIENRAVSTEETNADRIINAAIKSSIKPVLKRVKIESK